MAYPVCDLVLYFWNLFDFCDLIFETLI